MKITQAKAQGNYRLFLRFDDGVEGIVDLSDLAGQGVFEAWKRDASFEKARVTEFGAVEWPGELDLCPDSLYLRLTGKKPEDIFPALRERMTHA